MNFREATAHHAWISTKTTHALGWMHATHGDGQRRNKRPERAGGRYSIYGGPDANDTVASVLAA
jgi:hypothetical protein